MAGVYGDVNPITVGPDGLSDRHKDGPGTAIEHAKRRSAERGFPRPFGPLLMKLCPSEPGVSTTAILQRLDIRPGVGPPGVVVRVKHERTVVGRVVLLAHAGRRVVGIACSQRVADVAARQGKAKVAYGLPAVAAHLTAIGELDGGSRGDNPGPRRFPWAAARAILARWTALIRAAVAPVVKPLAGATRLISTPTSERRLRMHIMRSRRDFLAGASLATAAGLLGPRGSLADEGPPEVTTIRLRRDPSICVAPWYIAEDLLRAEGFTEVRYVPALANLATTRTIGRGEIDFGTFFAGTFPLRLETGAAIAAVAGLHAGCFELFAHEPIRTISDLKGKKVGIDVLGSAKHGYVAIMAASVGLDPHKDIQWVEGSATDALGLFPLELFAKGEVDAFLGFPPEPQELRARKLGRVILDTTTDKPWSQYFCCMVVGNRDFIHDHPIATKRFLRAVLKANEICAADPAIAARRLIDRGFAQNNDYALQTLTELPYASWREFDPEDSLRFFALRLHEIGMIKSSPNELLAEGTDWRFLNELKRELKA